MRTIYKIPLEVAGFQRINIQQGARILKLDVQKTLPCIWYECDTTNQKETRIVRCFGTGHEMPADAKLEYIGSAQFFNGNGVFHFFFEND